MESWNHVSFSLNMTNLDFLLKYYSLTDVENDDLKLSILDDTITAWIAAYFILSEMNVYIQRNVKLPVNLHIHKIFHQKIFLPKFSRKTWISVVFIRSQRISISGYKTVVNKWNLFFGANSEWSLWTLFAQIKVVPSFQEMMKSHQRNLKYILSREIINEVSWLICKSTQKDKI